LVWEFDPAIEWMERTLARAEAVGHSGPTERLELAWAEEFERPVDFGLADEPGQEALVQARWSAELASKQGRRLAEQQWKKRVQMKLWPVVNWNEMRKKQHCG
jgi:hypothetical protein